MSLAFVNCLINIRVFRAMVAINPFNYEQIAIIFIFLSILVGILLFVRKNKDKISIKLHNEKRIFILEETAIGQSERLRLIKVGDETFLMSSGKGVSAQLIKLNPENNISKRTDIEQMQHPKSKKLTKTNLSGNKNKKYNTVNLTEKSEQKNPSETNSIFDAIKLARDKNPLLGFDK